MNTSQKLQIKVFGDKAKAINEDDIFIASVGDVEGRIVVTLKPKGELMVISEQQIKWLHKAAGICRGSYENARHIQSWIIDILDGRDMTEEFEDFE